MKLDMSLLEMSLSASLFILVVIGIRAMLLHKIPRLTFVLLWSVAFIRLLVPLSVPISFSALTMMGKWTGAFVPQEGRSIPSDSFVVHDTTRATGHIQDPVMLLSEGAQSAAWLSPVLLIWMIGFILCLLSIVLPHLRSRREYRMSLPLNHEWIRDWQQAHPLRRRVHIRQSDTIATPLTYGILKPVVLLPKSLDYTDKEQLAFILTHEYVHIRRFDILKIWLLAICLCVHWFNPLVWVMYVLANRDIELSCDEAVVRTLGQDTRSAYAMTLVRYAGESGGRSAMASYFSKSELEERIRSIMKMRKLSIPAMLLAAVIVAGSVTFFATSPLNATKKAAENDAAESTSALYREEASAALMPIDITFTRSDVPHLMERLEASEFKAFYVDDDMFLRVHADDLIWMSRDGGKLWGNFPAAEVDPAVFAEWLLHNDPNPGYRVDEMQERLASGAQVKHMTFERGKEIYFVMDESGVQMVLVQPQKLASVLLDGNRLMLTSKQLAITLSESMLHSFFDLLVANDVLTETEARYEHEQRISHFEDNESIFTVTE